MGDEAHWLIEICTTQVGARNRHAVNERPLQETKEGRSYCCSSQARCVMRRASKAPALAEGLSEEDTLRHRCRTLRCGLLASSNAGGQTHLLASCHRRPARLLVRGHCHAPMARHLFTCACTSTSTSTSTSTCTLLT